MNLIIARSNTISLAVDQLQQTLGLATTTPTTTGLAEDHLAVAPFSAVEEEEDMRELEAVEEVVEAGRRKERPRRK